MQVKRRAIIFAAAVAVFATQAVAQSLPNYEILPYRKELKGFNAIKIDRVRGMVFECSVANPPSPTSHRLCVDLKMPPSDVKSSAIAYLPWENNERLGAHDLWLINASTGQVKFCLGGVPSKCYDLPEQ